MENSSDSVAPQSSAPKRGGGRVTKRRNRNDSAGASPRRRVEKVTAACAECRERKRKCSGTRPQCDGCVRKGRECVYGQQSLKRDWPSDVIETLNGRIAELERAQNLDARPARPPPIGWLGSSDSDLQSGDGFSYIPSPHPPDLVSNNVMSQAQLVTKVASQERAELESSSNKDAPVRASSNIARSTTSVTSGVHVVDADISVPTSAGTLDEDKDESCVDAMGATAEDETDSMSNGSILRSGFFGTSSTVSFMSKVQDAIRKFNVVPTINVDKGAKDTGQRVSTNDSNLNLALIGLPWETRNLDSECESIDYLVPSRREADTLVKNYFENVFILRPYLNRAIFQERYMKLWSTDEPDFEQEQEQASSIISERPNRTEIERLQFYLTLNLVFALACRLSPSSTPSARILRSERFFQRTQQPRILKILNYGSLELVQSLLLMGQYLQSTERSTQCWNIIGFAIRVAQGIGLHLDPPATTSRSQLEVEMRRRVWWGCIALDRELSMTYGRPCMVHPIMNCGIRLPSIIDDQFLSHKPAHKTIPSDGSGVSMAFFVYTLKLSNILCEILIMLHCQDCSQQRDSSAALNDDNTEQYPARPNTQTILPFDNLLNRWFESLPPYLRITRNGNGPAEHEAHSDVVMKAALKRQADILHAQYLHIRILLLRPLLLEAFNNEHASSGGSKDSSALNTILQREMLASISNTCVSIAQQQIDHIYNNVTVGGTKIYAWWYIVYYVYTSAIVVMTGRLCPSTHSLSSKGSLAESWDRALACLESYCIFSRPAQKGFKILTMIDERLFKSQNTSPTDEPVNNNSPSMVPRPMEQDQTRKRPCGNSMSVSGVTTTFSPTHPLEHPRTLQSAGEGNQNNSIDVEEPRTHSGMDFTWHQDDLQLDWLSSIPFVDDFQNNVFEFNDSSGRFQ